MAAIEIPGPGTWPVCVCSPDIDKTCGSTGCRGGWNVIGPSSPRPKKKPKLPKGPGNVAPPWVRNSRKKKR